MFNPRLCFHQQALHCKHALFQLGQIQWSMVNADALSEKPLTNWCRDGHQSSAVAGRVEKACRGGAVATRNEERYCKPNKYKFRTR